MHVYISVDMEGVAGVATYDQAYRGGSGYPSAQELMTGEANAAIAGAFDGGATAVTINDSHGTMDNLLLEKVDPRVEIVLGTPKAQCMMHGLAPEHDVALFVGYHAAAGEFGVLSHSFSMCFSRFRVNGVTATEADVNALMAAGLGVPIGLVTGDDATCRDAVGKHPGVRTVQVKRAEGFLAATSLHPSVARDRIRAAAAETVAGVADLVVAPVPEALTLEVQVKQFHHLEQILKIPGFTALDTLTAQVTVGDPSTLFDMVALCYQLDPE